MSALHSAQTANHIIESWTYADAAARTGASGFVAGDVGKIAYQTDTATYWRLTAVTPTWVQATPIFQAAAVADATGGSPVDVEARAALNALLARLRTAGLLAT